MLTPYCLLVPLQASADGGGVQLQTSMGVGAGNTLSVTRSTFHNNTSGALGGAVAVDGQVVIIEESQFTDNHAGLGGGGVNVLSASSVVFSGTVFHNNSCNQTGGAVGLIQVEELVVKDVTVMQNKVGTLRVLYNCQACHRVFALE